MHRPLSTLRLEMLLYHWQIAEEVTIEGGYTKLSHSLSQGSPIHADNPVYLTADPLVVDEKTGELMQSC